jgi:hypothetical protein
MITCTRLRLVQQPLFSWIKTFFTYLCNNILFQYSTSMYKVISTYILAYSQLNMFINFGLQIGSLLYRKQFNNEAYYETVFGNF